MVKICCIGAGFVGGPTMAVIALKCPSIQVAVVDASASRIAAWNSNRLPVFEPGLLNVVQQCRNRNLFFSSDVNLHVSEADVIFLSVTAPTKTSGLGAGRAPDLSHWESAARLICHVSTSDKIVVEKSTVPVKTAEAIERILKQNRSGARFQVLSNPEFMAEGTAVEDLLSPDRVLIGGREDDPLGRNAVEILRDLYSSWVPSERIITMSRCSAELSKLAANAFLAQRVSSINAISALCEATGADVEEVAGAVGKDRRIGPEFLGSGVGFGGPCLKKDVLSLVYLCERHGLTEVAAYWKQVIEMNEYQKSRFVRRVVSSMFNAVQGKKIAVLGFSFKKNSGDTRDSPAIDVCMGLMAEGAVAVVYDPMAAAEEIQRELPAAGIAGDAYEACRGADAVCILTEWDEFRGLDFGKIFEGMKKPAFLFDGRNVVAGDELRRIGFVVYSVGKPLQRWLC